MMTTTVKRYQQQHIPLLVVGLLLLSCVKVFVVSCWSLNNNNNIQQLGYHHNIVQIFVNRKSYMNCNNQYLSTIRQFPKEKEHYSRTNSLCMTVNKNNNDNDDDDDDDDEKPIQSTNSGRDDKEEEGMTTVSNVIGTNLCECCSNVRNTGIGTGFYRNGYCSTGENDIGRHTVCVEVTDEFLQFSKSVGNDLTTPAQQYMFPGLKNGDKWCLCAQRWVQAYQAGMAPKLILQSTHEKTLSYVPFEILQQYALDKQIATDELDKLNSLREKLNKLL